MRRVRWRARAVVGVAGWCWVVAGQQVGAGGGSGAAGCGGVLAALRVPLLLDGWWWFTGGRGAVVSWFTPG